MKITTTLSLSFLLGTSYLPAAMAQTITGTPGSPSATTTIQGNQIPAPDPKFGGVNQGECQGFQAWWPPTIVRPRARLTCCLIMNRRPGLRRQRYLRRRHPDPGADRVAKSGAALHRIQLHRAVLADAGG